MKFFNKEPTTSFKLWAQKTHAFCLPTSPPAMQKHQFKVNLSKAFWQNPPQAPGYKLLHESIVNLSWTSTTKYMSCKPTSSFFWPQSNAPCNTISWLHAAMLSILGQCKTCFYNSKCWSTSKPLNITSTHIWALCTQSSISHMHFASRPTSQQCKITFNCWFLLPRGLLTSTYILGKVHSSRYPTKRIGESTTVGILWRNKKTSRRDTWDQVCYKVWKKATRQAGTQAQSRVDLLTRPVNCLIHKSLADQAPYKKPCIKQVLGNESAVGYDSKQRNRQNYESRTARAKQAVYKKHEEKLCIEQTPKHSQELILWLGQSTIPFTKALRVRHLQKSCTKQA